MKDDWSADGIAYSMWLITDTNGSDDVCHRREAIPSTFWVHNTGIEKGKKVIPRQTLAVIFL